MKPFGTTFAEYRAWWLGFGWVAELWIGRTPFCRLAMCQIVDLRHGSGSALAWYPLAHSVRSGLLEAAVSTGRLRVARRRGPIGLSSRAAASRAVGGEP